MVSIVPLRGDIWNIILGSLFVLDLIQRDGFSVGLPVSKFWLIISTSAVVAACTGLIDLSSSFAPLFPNSGWWYHSANQLECFLWNEVVTLPVCAHCMHVTWSNLLDLPLKLCKIFIVCVVDVSGPSGFLIDVWGMYSWINIQLFPVPLYIVDT